MCQYVNMPIGLRRPKKQAAAQLAYWHISILAVSYTHLTLPTTSLV